MTVVEILSRDDRLSRLSGVVPAAGAAMTAPVIGPARAPDRP
jgi:hypothetical protein